MFTNRNVLTYILEDAFNKQSLRSRKARSTLTRAPVDIPGLLFVAKYLEPKFPTAVHTWHEGVTKAQLLISNFQNQVKSFKTV